MDAINKGKVSENLKLEGIPYESESAMYQNDINLANSIEGSKYHVQHLSCVNSVIL